MALSSAVHDCVWNVIYVATENDSVYAFEADGLQTTALWHVSVYGQDGHATVVAWASNP